MNYETILCGFRRHNVKQLLVFCFHYHVISFKYENDSTQVSILRFLF